MAKSNSDISLPERQITGGSSCAKRLKGLFDEGSFIELDAFAKSGDLPAEVITGYGFICGTPVYAFSQNGEIKGGAMGTAHSNKIKKVYALAAKTGLPVIGIYDSKGAYITEGLDALAAYGDLILASNNLSGVVPQISLVLGNCIGSAAILAASADFVIISKDAKMFISEADDNSAENAAKSGTANIFADTEDDAIKSAQKLIAMLPVNNIEVVPFADATAPENCSCECIRSSIIDAESEIKLSIQFGEGVKTVFARIMGITCGIIDYKSEKGIITPDACVKAARFMRICDSFSIPVVSLINAEKLSNSENTGIRNAATLSHAYAEATTVKISVITGNAYGAVFTALAGRGANADVVFALPDSKISVMSPQAAAIIMMGERRNQGETLEELAKEYSEENATPLKAAASGYIDDIVNKNELRQKLYTALQMLSGKRVTGIDKKHSNIPL